MLSATLIAIIKGYQYSLSAVLGNRCRFYPSCSEYFINAIEMHGPIQGLYLGARRLMRCHPLCEGGIDLVPQKAVPEKHDQKHKA